MKRKTKLILIGYIFWIFIHFLLFIYNGPKDYRMADICSYDYDYDYECNDFYYSRDYDETLIDVRSIFDMDNALWPDGCYDLTDFIFYVFTPIMIYIIVKLFKSARKDKKKKDNVDIDDMDCE